jgi:hypothetical protein
MAMAGQRRGELPGLRGRRGSGGARRLLGLIALVCLSSACEDGGGGLTGIVPGSGTGVGASSGTNTTSSPIAGTWQHTLIVRTQTDIITSETTWIFSAGGGCQRTVVSTSFVEGIPLTTRVSCSYHLVNGTVTIQFSSGGPPVSFGVQLSGGHLFLGGTEFVRIG